MMEIRRVSVAEFFADPSWPELRQGYAEECGVKGLKPTEAEQMYLLMEQMNLIEFYAAFHEGRMIGFVTVLTNTMPHYNRRISIVESIYVGKQFRKVAGTGLALIRHAESAAKAQGSPGIFLSAPANSRMEKLLPRLKYRHSNTIFFKEFS